MIKGLLKRSSIYFFGLTAGKVVTTLAYILLARHFLPHDFGQIVLYATILNIAGSLGNFGLNQYFQKKAQAAPMVVFQQVIRARLFLYLLIFVLIAVCLGIFKPFDLRIASVLLLSLLPESLISLLDGYYLHAQNPLPVALSYPMRVIWILIGLLWIPSLNFSSVTWLYLMGCLTVLLLWFPREYWRTPVISSWREIKTTLRGASHYALLITSAFAYARGDALVVRARLDSASLGLYSAGYRYLEGLSLIPAALNQNLFALAAGKQRVSQGQLAAITLTMVIAGGLFSVMLFLAAEFLTVNVLGSAYAQTTPVVRILSLSLFLLFINAPLSAVVQSSEQLRTFLPWGIANTLLNLLLNWTLIPLAGITIAAWVMTITEITGLLINGYFVYRVYKHV